MAGTDEFVTIGIDTHKLAHQAAVITQNGERLASQSFSADLAGYKQLQRWAAHFGRIEQVGIEGCKSYGTGVSNYFYSLGYDVFEVMRPDKMARRRNGKDDTEDAYQAAYGVFYKQRGNKAKYLDEKMSGLKALKIAYEGAIRAKTQAANAFDATIIAAPDSLRKRLSLVSKTQQITLCKTFQLKGKHCFIKESLKEQACRICYLKQEIERLRASMDVLVGEIAPHTLSLFGVGTQVACSLLLTVGSNISRIKTEACFAKICGIAPLPASSGNTCRHRLSRSGNRKANSALYTIALVRMSHDSRSQDFISKKLSEGKGKKEAIRSLKRYIAREVFGALKADLEDK